jgi:DNA-binding transcriptional LysR family regulator
MHACHCFKQRQRRKQHWRSPAGETDVRPSLGFLSGAEIGVWPEVNRLRDEFPGIEIRLSSDYSPVLAKALMRRKLDAAFMRPEEHMGDLACRRVRTTR